MRPPLMIAAVLTASVANAAMITPINTLNASGAAHALVEAQTRATTIGNPAAIAIVDGSGLLLAFVRMDGVRPGSIDLAISKARSAAMLRRPTNELEDNVGKGRIGLATVGLTALRGGAPIIVHGECVGAVGIAGISKEKDEAIAGEVAAAIAEAS